MSALARFRLLLNHRHFRRLVAVRILTQGADATCQVGVASYVLLNPQNQTNAWAVAAVIALVMAPFSLVGPFISPILDSFWRRQIVLACDFTRVTLSVLMAIMIATGFTSGAGQILLGVLLVILLSLNRLQLAALSAGLAHTVSEDEYLEACAIMPMIGPSSAVLFGATAGAIRLSTGMILSSNQADGLVFALAAALFLAGILGTKHFSKTQFGPDELNHSRSFADALRDLAPAFAELVHRPQAGNAFWLLFGTKVCYGALLTNIVVLYRNYLNDPATNQSIIQMGLWFVVSGAGFALSGLVATPVSNRFGVRNTLLIMLVASCLMQLYPAGLYTHIGLLIAAFGMGICAQSIKVCTDTIVVAHVSDLLRGRVMVLYDIVNNLGLVVGSIIAAIFLPPSGHSLVFFGALSLIFINMASVFGWLSRHNSASYNKGTVLAAN